jgi:hypothetical protein
MRRLVWIGIPFVIWVTILMILLLSKESSWEIIEYTAIDTIWWFRSPSFPDYAKMVAETDFILMLFGSAAFVLSVTNIAYNIRRHKTYITGYIWSFLLGFPLIISALNLLQTIDSTCYRMQGIVSTLYKETELLYCGATNANNAVAMTEIFHTVIWTNLVFGISLIVGSLILIGYNLSLQDNPLITVGKCNGTSV